MNGSVLCMKNELNGLQFISKTLFFAGIATAHPGETLNPFFERYVHKQTPLKEFIDKYELALQKKHKEESLSDIASLSLNIAELKTKCSFETQISRIYTRDMFKKFQVEVEEMYSCFSTTQLHVDGSFVIFLVRERVPGESNRREIRDFEVLYNRSVGEVRAFVAASTSMDTSADTPYAFSISMELKKSLRHISYRGGEKTTNGSTTWIMVQLVVWMAQTGFNGLISCLKTLFR